MLKTIVIIGSLGVALTLAGCAGGGRDVFGTQPVTTVEANQTVEKIKAAAKVVQSKVVAGCAWEPTLASIISLFGNSYGQTFDAVAGAVCNAVTSIPLADGGSRNVVVNGVRIQGRRVVALLK